MGDICECTGKYNGDCMRNLKSYDEWPEGDPFREWIEDFKLDWYVAQCEARLCQVCVTLSVLAKQCCNCGAVDTEHFKLLPNQERI